MFTCLNGSLRTACLTSLLSILTIGLNAQVDRKPLKDISESSVTATGKRYTIPMHYRVLQIDKAEMQAKLATAPLETGQTQRNSSCIFEMPMPDGSSQHFMIYETYVMHPDLAAKFPEIKTYGGQGIDQPASTIKLDMTPLGFHAMVISPGGNVFIDPYSEGTTDYYICYNKKDLAPASPFSCELSQDETDHYRNLLPSYMYQQKVSGSNLRTYRLALACTGEYAATKGGTVTGALAGMVTSMNRVNGVYEKEVAIRMVIIPNDTLIIYTNSSTDPYTNNNGSTMLGQNQTTCTNIIGTSNYDIGHVFSTGGGGVAGLGVVCNSSNKARGVTGSSNPVGDAFDIDYVAHEMGHQFGGNHTFNSTTGSCSGNRAASAAYEPGSGITIMAYAGICGSDNLASNSIAYFHTYSFDEIVNFSTTGSGNTCAAISATGNTAPNVTSQGANYSIPISTPFVLTGAATDVDGDALTYSWEEMDLGTAGAWNVQSTTAPQFMPFAPVTSPSRTFPKLSDIINNTTTVGELLPNQARTLKFRLTARDNRSGGGGVMHPDTNVTITVVNSGGAFAVTAPNTAVSWTGNSSQTVTWNVNGTTANGINTANVKISLSTDGGNTFPTVLLASTPNDGSESVTVPNVSTSQARIKVEAIGNIFFDMSNVNFTITPAAVLSAIATSTVSPLNYCAGASVSIPYTTTGTANAGNIFTAQLSNAAGSFASPVNIGTLSSTGAGTINATIPAGTATGSGYRVRIISSSPSITGSDNGSNITISAQVGAAGSITGSNIVCQGAAPFYSVSAISNATTYNWTIPVNANIISGAGTATVQIAFGAGSSGNVSVYGSNANCTGSSSTLAVTVNPLPTVFNVTGGGAYCSGGTGVAVGLNGSQSGVGYSLLRNGSGTGQTINGTGSAISFGNQTLAGTYTVNAAFATGCNSDMSGSAVVNINSNPSPAISGTLSFCAGNSTTLNAGAGYASYSWSTGATSQTIIVTTGATFTVIVTNGNGCTGSATATTTVNPLPTVSFSGLAGSYTVSDPAVILTGNPAGGVFSGPGISGNTFTPSSAGVGGPYTITYTYTNGNGCTNYFSQQTTVNNSCATPNQPGSITATGGNTKVCPGDSKSYSIAVVSGATSYTWTPPPGGQITSGQGTKSVVVLFTSGFLLTDSIKVSAVNACGTGPYRALKITRNNPATPGTISGQTYGVCNQNNLPYSVALVSGINYNWNFSIAGASVSSGQGTNSITASFTGTYTTGQLQVTASNACGTSAPRSLTVKATEAAPATILGPASVCANQQNVPYSITPVAGVTGYTWVGPSGSKINDGVVTSTTATLETTAPSVTINFKITAGNVKVRANNACGVGAYATLAVAMPCRNQDELITGISEAVIQPNPANQNAVLSFESGSSETISVRIFNLVGKETWSQNFLAQPGLNKLELQLKDLTDGIYFIKVVSSGQNKTLKLIKE